MADIDTSALDDDTDLIGDARSSLLQTVQRVNSLAAPTGAGLIGGGDQLVPSIAALRALLKTSASKFASVTGYYASGDGGGGAYWYDSTDTTTADNGGTVIVATDGGRWKLVITNGLVSFQQFGAKTDGSDSTSFVQAALDAAVVGSFDLLVAGSISCSGALSLTGKSGITVHGVSSGAPDGQGRAKLKFTGTGNGNFMAFTSCADIHFDGVQIAYTSSSYTGTLIVVPNSARMSFRKCVLIGESVTSASALLDLDTAIEIDISRNRFSGANYLVRGQRDDGAGYANVVNIHACDFDTYVSGAIRNLGQGWSVRANAFENATNGTGIAVTMAAGLLAMGFEFSGNWLGDATANLGFTWVTISGGTGIKISSNYINGTGFNLAVAIAFSGATSGVEISSNRFSSLLTAVAMGTALLSDSNIGANSYVSVTNRETGTLGSNMLTQEEGTWTPDLRFDGLNTGVTYTSRIGRYTKRGKQVFITFDIVLSSKGTATGGTGIYGLPFTSNADIGVPGLIGYRANFATAFVPECRIEDSNTILSVGKSNGVTTTALTNTDWNNTTRIAGSAIYLTA